jgi:hypothetical protein
MFQHRYSGAERSPGPASAARANRRLAGRAGRGVGGHLHSISADIALGQPLARQLHGQWVGSVCSQWISAGALKLEQDGKLSPTRRARLDSLMALDRRLLTADIRRAHPDIILIEKQSFDWVGWARADPSLAAELDAYWAVETIKGVTVWARKNRVRG